MDAVKICLLVSIIATATAQQPDPQPATLCQCPCNGVPGPQGVAGPPGASGSPGVGIQGPQGLTGPAGDPGLNGVHGVPGQAGGLGQKGEKGATGDGQPGLVGLKGQSGLVGSPGPRGQPGKAGPQGITGATGVSGVTGQIGLKGNKGDPGTSPPTPPMSAFTVVRTSPRSLHRLSGSETITYSREEFDLSNDMDHTTGIFTCSIAGYYYFSFNFYAYHGYPLDVRLYLNSTQKARIVLEADPSGKGSSGRYHTKSAGVALHLQVGDEVKLSAYAETRIWGYGDGENNFTGFLIHPF